MAPGLEIQRQADQGARRIIDELQEKKLYNATFVYDDNDLPWVRCAAHYLEENYEKSVYYRGRDATPGHPITDNSINSITNTDVIIVAISKAFLNNVWAKKEEDWALLHSVKTDGCKLLPVLLEDCDIPKELSDLEALNLTSMEKCEDEHLEQLGKGLHKLLANGQICQRAKSMLHPDRYLKFKLNGPELYHNGTLAGNNTTTTSDNESNDQGLPVMPYDLQCLLTLLNILACKLVAMSINSINILDSCIRGIPECFMKLKEVTQGFVTTLLEVLSGALHAVKETMQASVRTILMSLKRVLMSMLPAFLQDIVSTLASGLRFTGDGSFTTFAATWIYNVSVFHFAILLANGLLWQVGGYNVLQARLLDVVPLLPPLIKGYFCMLHMPEYRQTIKAMYGCKTLTLKSMKDTLVQANVEYREVRICLLVTFAIEFVMLSGILGSMQISSLLFPMTRLTSLLLLTLHFAFLLCAIIFYYHDDTVHSLISKRRFFFPDIMKKEGFDKQEKRLLSMIDELNKQRKCKPDRKHLMTGGKPTPKKYKRHPKPV